MGIDLKGIKWKPRFKFVNEVPLLVLLAAAVVVVLELVQGFGSTYLFVSALSIAYLLTTLVFYQNYNRDNVIALLVLLFNFIKYIVTPYVIILSDNVTEFNASIEVMQASTALMVAEIVFLNIAFWLFFHFYEKRHPKTEMTEYCENESNWYFSMNWLLVLFCIYVVVIWIVLPQSRDIFKTIFDVTDETFTWGSAYESPSSYTGIVRIALTVFVVLFGVVRILLPLFLIYKIKQLQFPDFAKILISLVIIATQLFFIVATIAVALIDMVILLYFLVLLYPRKKRIMAYSLIGCIVLFLLIYFIARYSLGGGYAEDLSIVDYMCNILNSYVPGVNSVAAGMNIVVPNPIKLLKLLGDTLYYCIPFNTTLFGYKGYTYAQVFSVITGTTGQIPSSLGMNYSFFSLMAPVVSVIFPLLGVFLCEKVKQTRSVSLKCVLFVAAFYLGASMGAYNFQIALRYIMDLVLFMAIAVLFERRKKLWEK